mgnify:CR=1 FL=1
MDSVESLYKEQTELFEALQNAQEKGPRHIDLSTKQVDKAVSDWKKADAGLEIQRRLNKINIFSALNVTDYETRHSDFLAWLLDPKQTHGLQDQFIDHFIEITASKLHSNQSVIQRIEQIRKSSAQWKNITIKREKHRIDLLLVDNANRFLCLIENKIHTGEHSKQLTRYREIIKDEYPDYEHLLIFLTLRPEKPSDQHYVAATYSDILSQLQKINLPKIKLKDHELYGLLVEHCMDFAENRTDQNNSTPNIFRSLRLREIKHSDYYAWLLDPYESHGQAGALGCFLRIIKQRSPEINLPFELNNIPDDLEVFREHNNIDILILSEKKQFVCIIENKLESREGSDQLSRYRKYIESTYPGFYCVFVFFTLRGDLPTDQSYIPLKFIDFLKAYKDELAKPLSPKLSSHETVSVMLQQYRLLLSDRLCLRIKTRIQLAPEMEKSCRALLQRVGSIGTVILSEIRSWQDDVQVEMEHFIGELVTNVFGENCYRPSRFPRPYDVFIPFIPEELDRLQHLNKGGIDPAYKGHIFAFALLNIPFRNPFQNDEPIGVTLKGGMLAVKPEYHEQRELIYANAKNNPELFNSAVKKRVGKQKNCLLMSHTLSGKKDFQRTSIDEVKAKIRTRLERFADHHYPQVIQMLKASEIEN